MEIDQEAKAVQEVNLLLEKVRKAQEVYSTYTQEQVDKIFRAAAIAANKGFAAIKLFTANATFLNPPATDFRTFVVPFPFLERSSTAPATPLTVFSIVLFASEAV